jgi:WD40 repeat protein
MKAYITAILILFLTACRGPFAPAANTLTAPDPLILPTPSLVILSISPKSIETRSHTPQMTGAPIFSTIPSAVDESSNRNIAITGENLQTLTRLHTFSGYAIAFHPQESIIATGELTGRIIIWSLVDGEPISDLTNLNKMIYDLDYSPDGKLLVVASESNAFVIDVENGENVATIEKLGQFIESVAFSPDGALLAVGGSNGIKVINTGNWEEIIMLHGHQGIVFDLDFAPDGSSLVSSGGMPDSSVIVWDAKTFQIKYMLDGHGGDVHSLAISPDSRYVVSGGVDRSIILWDLLTGESQQRLSGYRDVIYGLTYSPNGDLIAAGCGADGYIMLWDNDNPSIPFRLSDGRLEVRLVQFSPDGKFLAESNNQHQVIIWGH